MTPTSPPEPPPTQELSSEAVASTHQQDRSASPTSSKQSRKRSHTPPKTLDLLPEETAPTRLSPLKGLKKLVVQLKKIDEEKYVCHTMPCESSTASEVDCYIVEAKTKDPTMDLDVERVTFTSPPDSPDSPPAKKPKLEEQEE